MKILKLLIIILVILGATFWGFRLSNFYLISQGVSQIQNEADNFLIEEIHQKVQSFTPLPLRLEEKQNLPSNLTPEGVIQWTNIQRKKYGLSPLKENLKLDSSSKMKVDDMFHNQYFAHKSPQGLSVGDLVKENGYNFIEVGENLALGNFKNSEALVNAWMNSPGHRANILNPRYRDIGVAVKRGVFQGEMTWLAVQHFGFPLSACPQPDANLKKTIVSLKNEINDLTIKLGNARSDIQSTKFKYGPVYIRKVNYYNSLVSQYNYLVKKSKVLIDKYNSQVKLFNTCAATSPS